MLHPEINAIIKFICPLFIKHVWHESDEAVSLKKYIHVYVLVPGLRWWLADEFLKNPAIKTFSFFCADKKLVTQVKWHSNKVQNHSG